MEAHPEEDLHAMVQRALESAERAHRRLDHRPQRRRAAHHPHRGSLAEEGRALQQEAARPRAAHGERRGGAELHHQEGAHSPSQHW